MAARAPRILKPRKVVMGDDAGWKKHEDDETPADAVQFVGGDGTPDDSPSGFVLEPEPTIRVRVTAPHRVVHNGQPYVGGEVLEVPDDDEHSTWILSGWVTREPREESLK
jgi:hypothetical protein